MYGELAGWFHVLTSPSDYEVEAAFYGRSLVEAAQIPVTTVLELGSGGGNNASHMKRDFQMTLTDLADAMLALSSRINPECEHIQGDMRTLHLGRTFDAVFAHDALDYMLTESDLLAVARTAFQHCNPGGPVLFAPDHVRETFAPKTDHGGSDGGERSLRYLEWTWDPDPDDDTYTVDYAYLMREADGGTEVAHDRHICGLFERATWVRALESAGFEVTVRQGIAEETAPDIFIGVRPAAS